MSIAAHGNELLHGPTLDADPFSGFLSPRETEVVLLDAEGFTDKEIARMLNIAPRTVINHNESSKLKLDATNRANLVARAFAMGILTVKHAVAIVALIHSVMVLDHDFIRPGRARGHRHVIRVIRGKGGREDC